jgi:uncharacterized protein YcfJ
MKRLLAALGLAALSTPLFATSVGVSVTVGDPAYYGRIDVGNLPPPVLVYPQPIQAQPAPIGVAVAPVYLRVPPGHAKHWRKHCHRYGACGQPVYFVQDRWYSEVYAIHYQQRGGAPAYAAAPPSPIYVVPVTYVRAVVGPPEQRCWIERQQVVEERSSAYNIPGAVIGGVIGGVLGHQVGGGRGKDIATVGGATAGAVIGANVGRGGTQVTTRDVQRCAYVPNDARPAYWDVTYTFRGVSHRAQLVAPPGRTIRVDANGVPQG